MLKGLNISEVRYKDLLSNLRIDSETYRSFYIENEIQLSLVPHTTLDEISSVFKKGIFNINSSVYTDKGVPFVRISNLKKMSIDDADIVYIPESENEKHQNTFLKKGDVILSKTATAAASLIQLDCCNTSQDTIAIKLKSDGDFLGAYVVAFLNSKFGYLQMQRWFTGNIQMHLNLTDSKNILIPYATKTFQEAINQLFDDSFKLKASYIAKKKEAENILMDKIGLSNYEPQNYLYNVKSFKDSFFKTGRLDAEYYQLKFDHLEKAIKATDSYVIIRDIKSYNSRGLQPIYAEDGKLPIINSKHILEDGLNYENFEKTTPEYWTLQERARVFKNDILTYTTGAKIGRTQVYLIEDKALASNHVNILRLKEGYNPIYVGFVMNSIVGRLQTDKLSAGSAQAELYPKDIDTFLIPIIALKEQHKIERLIDDSVTIKRESFYLLELAKKAIEIAVIQGEKVALEYISENENLGME